MNIKYTFSENDKDNTLTVQASTTITVETTFYLRDLFRYADAEEAKEQIKRSLKVRLQLKMRALSHDN